MGDALERDGYRFRRRGALVGVGVHAAEGERGEVFGYLGVERRGGFDLLLLMERVHLAGIVRADQSPRREHLPEEHAEGEDVGAGVDVTAGELFGRHVAERADRDRAVGLEEVVGHLYEPEVHHVRRPVHRDQDVGG